MNMVYFEDIKASFLEAANPQQAVAMKAYMRNRFDMLGIKSPLRKVIAHEYVKASSTMSIDEVLNLIRKLWEDDYRDFQYVALLLIDKHKKKLNPSHLEFGEYLITHKSWWDTVDHLASNYFGTILKPIITKDIEYAQYCSNHENMWMNRVAHIFQLKYKNDVNQEFLYNTINQHKHSKEFFIQKAAGWALRQYSKYNPESVQAFLDRTEGLSNLTRREASKYLD